MSTQKPNGAHAPIEPEVVDPAQAVEISDDINLMDPRERAAIDMQIATAKRYPRAISIFRKTLQGYVTATPKIAERMNYSLPRGRNEDGSKKFIEGPSVRLAEAAVAAWKNTRSGGRAVSADATHVTCQGFCHDLENNNYVAFEVRRSIMGKSGRFNEDMITVTGAAGAKIAWRNAIFGVVPRAFIEEAAQMAKQCAVGALTSVVDARKEALAWWTSLPGNPKPALLLTLLGRAGMDDVNVEDLFRLKGLRTALEDGETTIAEILADARPAATVVNTPGLSPDAVLKGKATGENHVTPGKPAAKPQPAAPAPATTDEQEVEEAAAIFE